MDLSSQINHITNKYKRHIAETEQKVLEAVSKEIERTAKANFRRAEAEVPADDPHVDVSRHRISKTQMEIECGGDQVLFIEFGAGTREHLKTRSFGIEGEKETEKAPRPSGIYSIGGYGRHHGRDNYWFYNSVTGRISTNNQYVRTSKAGLQAMLTIGIRPHRALWRARNIALKKLRLNKLRGLSND